MSPPLHGSQGPQLLSESIEKRDEPTRKPSLLPAFEPSSSPFPRPQSAKRKFDQDSPSFPKQELKYYPTPVPTSSTGILLSSSPRNEGAVLAARSISNLSERVPLGHVPSVDLPANGEVVRMGRSSNSSDYQLSANRLISRVHVQASYHPQSASNPEPWVEIECLGWNGAKIHCRGQVYELKKGAAWASEDPDQEIMLDVQDARVMILWPAMASEGKLSWDSDDDGDRSPTPTPARRSLQNHFASSPPVIPRSPVSQSPIPQPFFTGLTAPSPAPVQVFEDADAGDENMAPGSPDPADETFIRPAVPRSASALGSASRQPKAPSSFLSSFAADDFSDGDEENDPVVHSFGPFGENLLPRFESFSATTPTQTSFSSPRRRHSTDISESPRRPSFKDSPIKNHVINQLAFSRIHSQPLSTIHSNLPAELKACVTKSPADQNEPSNPNSFLTTQDLKKIMNDIPCVGEIDRKGKDASGKPLENEWYYVPEMDSDIVRRDAITGGMRGNGLRNVRKSHKQYYWKRPRF
ncbi:hypothetical protein K504DRAFT_477150 [Pleomassaria siparia CBS 279.74]|uniref:FHA domain-containing protein n=1 Tax=Pleomassaria siparia CBS 279.74 TaxID=1314801 RepID=A0A6G1K780_9PLEO|nr:hypothetical protein K504DRAFT_477150 [Pleomassaria siparia CBS 279.74]